ncbi:hypothetical protein EW145_g7156 [Phellinidium pouzarii]|uniref:DUF6534 domain-containing protein n=1 Tax=Phellinidium pouzarii TaxID=167371 RepID=A0A4S4KST8_9AGAM|nr:hypothetical protein EW145_g7156 [Phellinidium pouzarii]
MIVLAISAYFTMLSWLNPSHAQYMTSCTYSRSPFKGHFFLLRIWTLSRKKKTITACIAVLIMLQITSGMAVVAKVTRNPSLHITHAVEVVAALQLSSSLAADLLITATLVFYLNGGRSAMDYAFLSNSVTNGLIFYAISTGLMTSLVTLVNLALFLAAPNVGYWIVPYVVSSKLYVNSLLATLNSRRSMRKLINKNPRLQPMLPRASAERFTMIMKIDNDDPKPPEASHSSNLNGLGYNKHMIREYDPHLDYDRDLLPPSPQSAPPEHDAVRIRRELLGIWDGRKKPTVRMGNGADPAGAGALPLTMPSPDHTLSTLSFASPTSPRLPGSPVSPTSHRSASPRSPESGWRDSGLSFGWAPSVHSSRLTARTFNTGTHTHEHGQGAHDWQTQTRASSPSSYSVNIGFDSSPYADANLPLPPSLLPSFSASQSTLQSTLYSVPHSPPLAPGDAFVHLGSIASFRNNGGGALRITGVSVRAGGSGMGYPNDSINERPKSAKHLPIGPRSSQSSLPWHALSWYSRPMMSGEGKSARAEGEQGKVKVPPDIPPKDRMSATFFGEKLVRRTGFAL